MNITRSILLKMSQNQWLKDHVPRWKFTRRAVRRFMPGETVEDALDAAAVFEREGIPAVFTRLGENSTQLEEAEEVREHYLDTAGKIAGRGLSTEISVKLTHLGLDLSVDAPFQYCKEIAAKANKLSGNDFFIDMEGSAYVQRTIDLYLLLKRELDNVGLCIQASLHRTEKDLDDLFEVDGSLRLVKGAYKEPPDVAIQSKRKVDEHCFVLSQKMLRRTKQHGTRMIYATHDDKLIGRIIEEAKKIKLPNDQVEFQMLYGIKTGLQRQLVRDGYKVRVLIAYGESWYPWYMRRLAERPANVLFVLRNAVFRG